MVETTWIVQVNGLPPSPSPALLRRACAANGRPLVEISVSPGAAELPSLPSLPAVTGPIVFHGRTTLILQASAHPVWRSGVFFSPESFNHGAYLEGYGDRMLNAGGVVCSWGELWNRYQDPEQLIFVKPNDDLKLFTGAILTVGDCFRMYQRLEGRGHVDISGQEVVVGRPFEIDAEYRFFVVESEIVAGTMYRPTADTYLPSDLMRFAHEAAATWSPAAVYVLDIARVDRTWKVVECNCFNGSAFYGADVTTIVRSVSEYLERPAGGGRS